MFYRNGLFIDTVVYHRNTITFEFACTPEKKDFEFRKAAKNLSPIQATYEFHWLNKQDITIYSTVVEHCLDYLTPRPVMIKLPQIAGAYALAVKMMFDGKLICVFKQPIQMFEML